MAHDISTASGRHEMAYAGTTPWHGLGRPLADTVTPDAMIREAGMDWTVAAEPLYLGDGAEATAYRAIVRGDTRAVLGIASRQYRPIQNAQNAQIVDALICEGQATVETAGVLGQGERCWMLARLPGDFEVLPGDAIRPYFLLAWGHDGKHGVAGKLTPIRVVCHNTLTAAGFGAGTTWRESAAIYLRHSGDVRLRIDEARRALGLAKRQAVETLGAYQAMAAQSLTASEVSAYFRAVSPPPIADPGADHGEAMNRWLDRQNALLTAFTDAPGAGLAAGSVWSAYNAVTHWADHVYPRLQSGATSATRQESVLFGAYRGLKTQAMTEALVLVS